MTLLAYVCLCAALGRHMGVSLPKHFDVALGFCVTSTTTSLSAVLLSNLQLTGQQAFHGHMQAHHPACELGIGRAHTRWRLDIVAVERIWVV